MQKRSLEGLISEEEALTEASVLKEKVDSGQAIDYNEATEKVRKERAEMKPGEDYEIQQVIREIDGLEGLRRTIKPESAIGYHPNSFRFIETCYKENITFLGNLVPERLYQGVMNAFRQWNIYKEEGREKGLDDNDPERQKARKYWVDINLQVADEVETFFRSCIEHADRGALESGLKFEMKIIKIIQDKFPGTIPEYAQKEIQMCQDNAKMLEKLLE